MIFYRVVSIPYTALAANKRMKELLLLSVSGDDKPGLTSALTAVLAQHGAAVLDIGQSVIHNALSLGLLVELPEAAPASGMLKELLFKAHELGVTVRFTPVSEPEYTAWTSLGSKGRYILTLLSRTLESKHLARLTKIVAEQGLNIDRITRLSGRVALEKNTETSRVCIEFEVQGVPRDTAAMRAALMQTTDEFGIDIAFQADDMFRRNRRLVAFDMDSTLIQIEVIDELAKRAGVGAEVVKITEAAMRGELDFKQSFSKRLSLLHGLPETVLKDIADTLPVTDGAARLISALKAVGYKTAILSGGFTYFGKRLQEKLGIDYVYANELEVENGVVTGRVVGEIVDGKRKAALLRDIAARENIRLEQVIAVGDGANDLPMLGIAGLGIAFRAKPIVKEQAGHAISTLGLDGILYLLGLRDRDIASEF